MLHMATLEVLHEFVGECVLNRCVGDFAHISPIFFDLLQRPYLAQAGVKLQVHLGFSPNGFQLTNKPLAWVLGLASRLFSDRSVITGDNVLVIEARA